MTRDEAIAKFTDAADPSSFRTAAWIDRFVALGMLKIDTEKCPSERALDAMFSFPPCKHGLITPRHALDAIDAAGLKIVEK